MRPAFQNHIVKILCYLIIMLAKPCLLAADDSKWRFITDQQIVSVGDIHGAFDNLVSIMQKTALLDENNNWIGGKTHFVSTGDLVDRGPDSRKVMDLLMKLEKQASDAGGQVHILLGNHEVMNLIGDRRYISKEEYAAFIPEESLSLRKKQFEIYKKRNNINTNGKAKIEFKKNYPPGYFGLHQAFGGDGIYGSWLRSKPFMIVINKKLMVHGGLSKSSGDLGLAGVNTILSNDMKQYADLWYWLVDIGFFSYDLSKLDRIKLAKDLINGRNTDKQFQNEPIREKVKQFLNVAENTILNGQESPTWYRKTFQCHEYTEQPLFNKVLTQLGADSAFVGHSNTYSHIVESRFNGRFFLQDTGMLSDVYDGQASLLIHSNDSVKVYDATQGLHDIKRQSPRNWYRPYDMTDNELENFLLNADIANATPIESDDGKKFKLTLKKNNKTIYAIYYNKDSHPGFEKKGRGSASKSKTDRYQNEIATYRISKLLALDMIPVSVERTFEGKKGIVQYWFNNSYNVQEMINKKIGYNGRCSQESQMSLMKVIDRLIFNEGRNADNMIYQKKGWHLWLIGNSSAFRTTSLKPYKINWKNFTISNVFRNQLKSLNKKSLQKELGAYLNKKQIEFILRRRDEIVSKAKRLK